MTRVLAAAALLALAALYVATHPPDDLAAARGALASCPVRFGDWNGTDLSFEDAVIDELKADDILIRRYQKAGDRVWLCIVYHRHRRYGAHDPTLCYESQGYLVEHRSQAHIDDGQSAGLTVNRFTADRRHDRRVVYYWWSTAGLSTADVGDLRRRMALSGVLDDRSWGAFVRVEGLVTGGDDRAAERRVADFASRVARALPTVFDAGAGAARP